MSDMKTIPNKNQIDALVQAAIMAGSVIYCAGMFELSEKIAYKKICDALIPFGGMPKTRAMQAEDKWHPHAEIYAPPPCAACFGQGVVPGKDGVEPCSKCATVEKN